MKSYLNSKGSITDFMSIIILVVLIGGLFVVVGWKLVTVTTPIAQDVLPTEYDGAIDAVANSHKFLDGAYAFLFLIICVISIVLAYFIKTHPVFFFILLLGDFFIIVMAKLTSNVFANILGLDYLSDVSSLFPMTNFIGNNLTIIILVLVIIQAVVMWSAIRNDI